ncbi:23452_t:CDS:2 [Gigaspora margarita]|uniref:23452_t:CDS:1 n=1 Tax=Gigaspora margarita TaxID=4874 RepID=A0ABN7V9D5_GIGMA|nr:23452_t:CDS:2 [Gigaspora margarita]
MRPPISVAEFVERINKKLNTIKKLLAKAIFHNTKKIIKGKQLKWFIEIENLIAEQDNQSIEDIRVNSFMILEEENKDEAKEIGKGQRHNKSIQIKEGAEIQNSDRDVHDKKSKEILEIYKTIQKYIRNTMEKM